MSSTENHENSAFEGLKISGLVQNHESIEQLSFAIDPTTPAPMTHHLEPKSSPGIADEDTAPGPTPMTYHLEPKSSPGIADEDTAPEPALQAEAGTALAPLALAPGSTRALLLESQPAVTQALANMRPPANTTAQRPPIVIRGSGRQRVRSHHAPQGHRSVISLAALVLLLVITGGTLFAVSPLGREVGFNPVPFTSGSSLIQNGRGGNLNLVTQQATATATFHQQTDGFDPNAGSGGPVVTGSPHPWPVGECTYWANSRYHTLTGIWVTWTGDAYQWAAGAKAAGWNVSSTPHIPSIVVLMPGVQGASGFGHVAVAEKLVNSTTVDASNMNWYADGGGFDIVSHFDFTTGSGVYFIWK